MFHEGHANTTLSFEFKWFSNNRSIQVTQMANGSDMLLGVGKAEAMHVQNNDGTINGANCMVSANTDAGFSIIKYNR